MITPGLVLSLGMATAIAALMISPGNWLTLDAYAVGTNAPYGKLMSLTS